jgi:tRNA(Ile)-lysidine synthase
MTELEVLLESALLPAARDGRWWVAYSGGLDSSVMLALSLPLAKRLGRPLHALHVNHGLSTYAEQWETHCAQVCDELGVPLAIERVSVERAGGGLEAAARDARYKAFARHVDGRDALLLAHHAGDQSETLLLRLMRGTGVEGLVGMSSAKRLQKVRIIRPWLNVPRSRLEQVANRLGLTWVDDDSNASLTFDRNYVRHAVLPALRERWPAADEALARVSRHAASTVELLADLAEIDFSQRASDGGSLAMDPLLSRARLANLIRHACRRWGLPLPPESAIDTLWSDIVPAAEDASPLICWPGGELRKYRRQLFLMPPLASPALEEVGLGYLSDALSPSSRLVNGGVFRWESSVGKQALCVERVAALSLPLRLCWRRSGESFRPAGRARRPLKKWWQDAGVAPWWRERTPLLYAGDILLAVPGLGVSEGFQAEAGQSGWCPLWIPSPGLSKDNEQHANPRPSPVLDPLR